MKGMTISSKPLKILGIILIFTLSSLAVAGGNQFKIIPVRNTMG